ncbi:MAG: hypothetical protein GX932_08340 [Methanomicrobiales archaeon]|nr:hypothetical protein [Methanomicrobiales archaeon]
MEPMFSYLSVVIFVLLIVLLPAIFNGVLSLGFYHVFAKAQHVTGKLAPILIGLLLAVLVPVLSFVPLIRPVLPVLNLVIILMGVLTPFMLIRSHFPDQHLSKILFSGSVITVALLLVYGFATAFGDEGTGSPAIQLLTSLPLPEMGFLIMSLIILYLEAALISVVVFGVILVVVIAFRREVQSG